MSDVAWAVVEALEASATIGREFNISGAAPLTYKNVVRLTAQALGRRVQRVHIPARPTVAALQAVERLGFTFPIKAEQVLRLNEEKAFSHAEAAQVFGYAPMAFEQGIRQEVALFRSGGEGLSI